MRARDPEGLRRLLETYGGRVQWSLRREFPRLHDGDLDDVLNAASYSAWRSAASYDPGRGTVAAWFYVIARHAAVGLMRQRSRESRHMASEAPDLRVLEAPGAAPDAGLQNDVFARDLRTCIDRLPRLQRAILEADLRTGDVAEGPMLAEQLDTTLNSIYVSRSIARKSLRKCLAVRGYRFSGPEHAVEREAAER